METKGVKAVFSALNANRVRYLVAGGLAVVAHGYLRTTQDIDLVLDLVEDNTRRALEALEKLGYQPTVPVPIASFADAQQRESWSRDKGAMVFQLFSDENPTVRVDLFLTPPFDFEPAYGRAKRESLEPDLEITFVGLDDLIAMKRSAGRPQDQAEVEKLETIKKSLPEG